MKIDFKEIFDAIKTGISTLATNTVKDFLKSAKKDGQDMLKLMQEDLERWIKLLANGDITQKEFNYLLLSEVASVKMEALKKAGLAAIEIDNFKAGITNIITDTVFGVIGL